MSAESIIDSGVDTGLRQDTWPGADTKPLRNQKPPLERIYWASPAREPSKIQVSTAVFYIQNHRSDSNFASCVVPFIQHGTVSIVEDRLTVACDLAAALDAGEVEDFREFSEDYEDLPRGAHAWPEIQTVVAAHRSGMPVLWRKQSKPAGGKGRRERSNMYEPDISSDDDGIDVTTFSYAQVHVSRAVRDAFEGDELELRILLGCAVRHGSYKPGRGDSHIVSYDGHSFVLTPDASAVIGYKFFKPRPKQQHKGEEVEALSLEESGFDPSKVEISERVIDSFSNKHGTDEDEAEEEIRDFIADAIERDRHKVAKNGCHVFDADGYTVWVSPDARRVTKYETRHIERTPRDVREGVPSRFSKPREKNREETL